MRTRTNRPESLIEQHNLISLSQLRAEYLPAASKLSWPGHHITLHTPASLSTEQFDACFDLVSDNMKDMYKRSNLGWKPGTKRREMRHPAMRFLVLETEENTKKEESTKEESGKEEAKTKKSSAENSLVIGFLSFMVTEEEGMEVIYCYEIHLASKSRRQGFGERLLALMEDFGRVVGLEKAMLTVFVENDAAIRFYHRLGYTVDDISPVPKRLWSGELKAPSYQILSKELKNKSLSPKNPSVEEPVDTN